MNPTPTCMTCDHWHVIHPWNGWCNYYNGLTNSTETCDKHVPVKIEPIDKLKNPPQPVDKEEWFS